MSHVLAVLVACDHYARGLTRVTGRAEDPATRDAVRRLVSCVGGNLEMLSGTVDGHPEAWHPADDLLDATQVTIDRGARPSGERHALTVAVRCLRHIDRATVELARDL